ncbi:MAG: hypothetical protein KER_03059 [Kerstersia gyiorum]
MQYRRRFRPIVSRGERFHVSLDAQPIKHGCKQFFSCVREYSQGNGSGLAKKFFSFGHGGSSCKGGFILDPPGTTRKWVVADRKIVPLRMRWRKIEMQGVSR